MEKEIEKNMQSKSDLVCGIIGITPCKIQLSSNIVSRYKRFYKTIKMRSKERPGMLPVMDAFFHELSHHLQYEISYSMNVTVKSHDSMHYTCLVTLLDFFGHTAKYDWSHEYASHRKRYYKK